MSPTAPLFSPLPHGPFDVVLADPPWAYYGQQDKWAAAGKHYRTLDEAALSQLPIGDVLHRRSVLFLWATCPKLDVAVRLLDHWGLTFRGVAFVWAKTRRDGTPIGAQGVRPSITKPLTELVLAASYQATGRPLPLASESVAQTVFAPRREHSRKPDEVRDRIGDLYPDASKLELFARDQAAGWTTWGEEAPAAS